MFFVFRIPDNLSFFRHQPPCSPIFNTAATRCGCNTTYPICSNKDPTLGPVSSSYGPFSGKSTTGVVCDESNQRIRRDTDTSSLPDMDSIMDEDTVFPPYTYDPSYGENVTFTWPTPKGKTQVEVEQYCADMLRSSPAYDDCSANVDVATIIAMCASDIQVGQMKLSSRPSRLPGHSSKTLHV